MRALELKEVLTRVGLKTTQLREMIAEGRFPKPTTLGKRKLHFLESEVDAWIAAEFAKRGQKGGR